jgi:pyruvate,water dikinase
MPIKIFSKNRENLKQRFIEVHYYVKMYLLRIAEKLFNDKIIANPDDIYFMRICEIEHTFNDLTSINKLYLVKRIDRRKLYYTSNKKRRHLSRIIEIDGRINLDSVSENQISTELHGIACSPGLVRGKARVLYAHAEGKNLKPGEILVSHSANPGWIPFYLSAAGIVTEIGGALSHSAIIAREYSIPMVASVDSACKIINTGDDLSIDGSRGMVRIITASNGVIKNNG